MSQRWTETISLPGPQASLCLQTNRLLISTLCCVLNGAVVISEYHFVIIVARFDSNDIIVIVLYHLMALKIQAKGGVA